MLDKNSQSILDAFRKNTLEVCVERAFAKINDVRKEEDKENSIQINTENILPGLNNVGA